MKTKILTNLLTYASAVFMFLFLIKLYTTEADVFVSFLYILLFIFVLCAMVISLREIQKMYKRINQLQQEKANLQTQLSGLIANANAEQVEEIKTEMLDINKVIEDIKNIHTKVNKHEIILQKIATATNAVQGLLYVRSKDKFKITASYAHFADELPEDFHIDEGINGQVAKSKTLINITNIPENYHSIVSGLGNSTPKQIIIVPIVHNEETVAVAELAFFTVHTDFYVNQMNELCNLVSNYFVAKAHKNETN